MPGPVRNPAEAYQQLEAIMLRQMLQSSGAFRASSTPGAQLRTDMFVETLADAVAKAGGLGVARMLERQQGGAASPAASLAASASSPTVNSRWSTGAVGPSGSPGGRATNAIDDLDDPNSEAPLPEDPMAESIDDYQPGARPRRTAEGPTPGAGAGVAASAAASVGEVTDQVTSGFGPRVHPITGDVRFHTGVDLRAPEGAPIRAAAAGVVREAGHRGGYGNLVEIDHGNGTSTVYAHASALLVSRGQRVEEGQPVALVGQTGHATGPHLHFELRRHDHPVDPAARNLVPPTARALNRYRERDEASVAGTPSGAGDGGKR